jgi:hypothetical protein
MINMTEVSNDLIKGLTTYGVMEDEFTETMLANCVLLDSYKDLEDPSLFYEVQENMTVKVLLLDYGNDCSEFLSDKESIEAQLTTVLTKWIAEHIGSSSYI